MNKYVRYGLNRLSEKSTWGALIAIGGLFGMNPEIVSTVGGAVSAVAMAAVALVPEKGEK